MMDEPQVVAFPFGAVFGGGFEVGVEEEMAVAGEVPEQAEAANRIMSSRSQSTGGLSIYNSDIVDSGTGSDLHNDSGRG